MKKAVKSKIDLALETHMRELELFFFGTKPKAQLSSTEAQELQFTFDIDASIPRRRGRPFSHRSRDERTFQSFEAFVFVAGEMRIFKQRNGLKQVPKRVQAKFIEFARRMSPNLVDELVIEHLRKDQTILPPRDEPTYFQLVRHDYEDGTVANVIVACPANERLKLCTQEQTSVTPPVQASSAQTSDST